MTDSVIYHANLADLTSAGPDSIISRTLSLDDQARVILFTFAPGQELSEHTAPYDALAHILEGEAEVRISGQPFAVKMGQAIILPANQPHALKATLRFKMLLTMIRA